MGCDIHMYAEVKNSGIWHTVGRIFKDDYHRPENLTTIRRYDDGSEWENNKLYTLHPYHDRNYRLFSILAGVRNSDGIVPIANPRGIPNDVSKFVKHEVKEYGDNGHSHSWLSLQELEDYPWDEMITSRAFVDQEGYQTFKQLGRPNSWCGGVSGGKTVMVDNEEMERIVTVGQALKIDYDHRYCTAIEWQWKAGEATRDFSDTTIPALQALREKQGVQDVRIVFFFDN